MRRLHAVSIPSSLWLGRTYAKVIHIALKLRYLLLSVFFAGLATTYFMYNHVLTGFIPQEDQNYLDMRGANTSWRFIELHDGTFIGRNRLSCKILMYSVRSRYPDSVCPVAVLQIMDFDLRSAEVD